MHRSSVLVLGTGGAMHRLRAATNNALVALTSALANRDRSFPETKILSGCSRVPSGGLILNRTVYNCDMIVIIISSVFWPLLVTTSVLATVRRQLSKATHTPSSPGLPTPRPGDQSQGQVRVRVPNTNPNPNPNSNPNPSIDTHIYTTNPPCLP